MPLAESDAVEVGEGVAVALAVPLTVAEGDGESTPPPPVGAVEPDIRGATTIRELLAKHRNAPACASCHNQIDPPGFALENFDPIGNWRDFYRVTTRTKAGTVNLPYSGGRPVYRGLDVEKGGQTPDGRNFADITDYRRILLEDKDQLARNLTQKLLIYSTGADIQYADREVVEQIVAKLRAKNYGFRTLVHEVVQEDLEQRDDQQREQHRREAQHHIRATQGLPQHPLLPLPDLTPQLPLLLAQQHGVGVGNGGAQLVTAVACLASLPTLPAMPWMQHERRTWSACLRALSGARRYGILRPARR